MGSYTNINKINCKNIIMALDVFRCCGFPAEDAQKLICYSPIFLSLTQNEIETRLNDLVTYFSKKYVYQLVANSPSTLIESWEDIESRIEYITRVMGLPIKSILATPYFFSYSLQHIKTRHVLLQRMGLYVKPDKYGFTPDYV